MVSKKTFLFFKADFLIHFPLFIGLGICSAGFPIFHETFLENLSLYVTGNEMTRIFQKHISADFGLKKSDISVILFIGLL